MAIPPFNDLRLKKGEWPKQARLEELLEGYARNFEDLYNRAQTVEASNEAGNSFLRLVKTGKHKIAYGTKALTYGGGVATPFVVVTHGLGTTPTVVVATSISANGSLNETANYGATTFEVRASCPFGAPVAGTVVTAAWVAVS